MQSMHWAMNCSYGLSAQKMLLHHKWTLEGQQKVKEKTTQTSNNTDDTRYPELEQNY